MAYPDYERAKACSAPGHRRLRDRADADCTADTPSTGLPRSRRDSAGAADPVGSLSSDQTEVLHHCGWSGDAALWRAACAGFAATHVPLPVAIPFLDRRLQPQLDQPQHVPVGDAAGHRFEEVRMRDRIEISR